MFLRTEKLAGTDRYTVPIDPRSEVGAPRFSPAMHRAVQIFLAVILAGLALFPLVCAVVVRCSGQF